jgi:hypothetical protein
MVKDKSAAKIDIMMERAMLPVIYCIRLFSNDLRVMLELNLMAFLLFITIPPVT